MERDRSIVTLKTWTIDEIKSILVTALWIRDNETAPQVRYALNGQTVAVIIDSPSLVTHILFQEVIQSLGGTPIFLNADLDFLNSGGLQDVARFLSQYVNGCIFCVNSHQTVQQFSRWAKVPIFDTLSDEECPLKLLADMLSLYDYYGRLEGLRLVYVGDGSCPLAYSYMVLGAKLGMHVTIASPRSLFPGRRKIELTAREASRTGGIMNVTDDPLTALLRADAIAMNITPHCHLSWGEPTMHNLTEPRLRALSKEDVVMLPGLPSRLSSLRLSSDGRDGDNMRTVHQAALFESLRS